jgi:hypothetical protein
MGRSIILIFSFLLVFLPAVQASEKPVKAGKINSRTHCRAKTVVSRYPVLKLNKKDSEKNKNHKKSNKGKYCFPV